MFGEFYDEEMNFTNSYAYQELMGFLEDINHKIEKDPDFKPRNEEMLAIIDTVRNKIENTELEKGPHRFANSAALRIHKFVQCLDLNQFFKNKLNDTDIDALSLYFKNSFGNEIRLDYGTGHEINFLAFLYTANTVKLVSVHETHILFQEYFELIRLFIFKFNIEPAGSNGMFAIDDYNFLPFLFGSAELISTNLYFSDLFEKTNKNLMYAQAINFCQKHKCKLIKTPFEKHSKVLYDMREMNWTQINEIVMRMIREKVFNRNVVMQHFIFSEYLYE